MKTSFVNPHFIYYLFTFEVSSYGQLNVFLVPETVTNVAITDIKENSVQASWNASQGNNKFLYFPVKKLNCNYSISTTKAVQTALRNVYQINLFQQIFLCALTGYITC